MPTTSDVTPWLVHAIAFVFGALWGSFFNVAIYRWPLGLSVVSPPSHCPTCGTAVPPFRNVPVIGYLVLRGRAACCGARLSPRYVVVEVLAGLLCMALAQRYIVAAAASAPLGPAVVQALLQFVLVGALLVAAFVDMEHMEIPDEVSLPGAALGLLTAGIRPVPGPEDAALGAGMGFLLVQLVFVWSYERLTGRRGMGEGDAKLLMMIGAFLGWQGVLFSLVAGAAQGILLAAPLILWGRRNAEAGTEGAAALDTLPASEAGSQGTRSDGQATAAGPGSHGTAAGHGDEDDDPPPAHVGHLKLPFGPFLSLAALEYLFFGDLLIQWYVGLLAT